MIELKNITKEFNITKKDKIKALDNIDLTIGEGELIILKGASGSGKSTILSLIAALAKPTEGEVVVDTKRISKLPDKFAALYRRENIGFIFQRYNLIPNLSVEENILLPLFPSNPDKEDISKKLDTLLEKFDISDKKDQEIQNLSGGEQQRVAISRSLINDPKIIIADEPTANLDEKLSKEFCETLKELKGMNKTIVVATHDPIFFELDFVDRIVEIKKGVLVK